jgi:hypothetical protein
MNPTPEVTIGHHIKGFAAWYTSIYKYIQQVWNEFSDDTRDEFETIENFAIELFFELHETWQPICENQGLIK